ncbi:MAG: tripartite tricarboxylate transporter substrate binding protein [Rubrivivax sp.]
MTHGIPRRAALGALAAWAASRAGAQAWPAGPVRLVVPYPAGGNADAVARLIGAKVAPGLGQTVVIENKVGAGGTIGAAAVAKAAADGQAFLVAPTAVLAITPHLRKVGYEPLTELVPVAKLSGSYGIVTARKDLPASTMAEFVALAKKDPGRLTFGSAGNATATHISGEIVHRSVGVKLLHVPFKGSAEALNDLLAGRIDLIYDAVGLPQVKAGQLKALAVTSKERHPELPQVQTLAEQGIDAPGGSWFGVFAPRGTASAVVSRLAAELQKVVNTAETREQLARVSQYPEFMGPEAFAKAVAEDSAFFKDLIAQLGLKAE